MTITAERSPSAPPTPATGRRYPDHAATAAALLVVAGLVYRLVMTLNIAPATNSDESTMGLAGLHIAEGRQFPAFFYGQHHMGTLEAYLAAPLFAVFGPSIVALRLPMLLVYALFCYLMYRLCARLYDRWFAVFVVALLALGSNAVVRGEMFAGGGYPEIKPLGAGALLLALWLVERTDASARRRRFAFAGWGLIAGLAVWVDWLILPYVAAAAVVLVLGSRRELLGLAGPFLMAGMVIGVLPSVVHNLAGGGTLADMLRLSTSGDASVGARLYGGVLLGVPLGTGLCDGGGCAGWPLALGATYPLLLLLAGTLAVLGLRAGHERSRHGGRLALVVGAALTLIAYAQSDAAGRHATTSVRYLTPLLISLPAVLWPLWSATARLARGHTSRRVRSAGIAGSAMLAVYACAMVFSTVAFIGDLPGSREAARDERALVSRLDELGVTRMYGEYWTCNRVAFATRERTVCATLADDLRPGPEAYRPHRDLVAATPNPAYVLPIGSALDRAFVARLHADGTTAAIDEVAGYRIYRPDRPVAVPIR